MHNVLTAAGRGLIRRRIAYLPNTL